MGPDTCSTLALVVISSASGLFGALIGGLITARVQRKERIHRFLRDQLEKFYSPLLGLRARILAKSETRLKISGAGDAAWRRLVGTAHGDPHGTQRLVEERFPDFEKVITDSNRELVEEILPLYREMLEIFSSNMWLCEKSTRQYFAAFAEFVEIWDRWLGDTLPQEVVQRLGHSEEKLHPFYADLASQLESLRGKLGE